MKREFAQSELDLGQDPEQWIQSLELKRRRLQISGYTISEMDLMIHILQNLTKDYENVEVSSYFYKDWQDYKDKNRSLQKDPT